MANNILFIFEGEKTEVQIKKSMENYYFKTNETVLVGVFCSDIYTLFHTLENDEDLELFYLLKEKRQNKEILEGINFSDVAETYLFFDYDAHIPAASDEKLQKMLDFFDEETDKGKLYISYPMVESLRHLGEISDYQNLTSPVSNGKKYKGISANDGHAVYNNIINLSEDNWKSLNKANLMKANYLVDDNYVFPTKLLSSFEIFKKQKEKHLVNENVAILSGFPLFLLDYYGVKNIQILV